MDGYRVGTEECDDGNTDDNDGCSNTGIEHPNYDCGSPIAGGDICTCRAGKF